MKSSVHKIIEQAYGGKPDALLVYMNAKKEGKKKRSQNLKIKHEENRKLRAEREARGYYLKSERPVFGVFNLKAAFDTYQKTDDYKRTVSALMDTHGIPFNQAYTLIYSVFFNGYLSKQQK